MKPHSSQNGSAFFLILIAIAIFGALSYVVFKDSRSSSGTLTKEKSKLVAQEIVAYGDTLATAVQKLRLANCMETELDFANSSWVQPNGTTPTVATGHNPSAPSSGCSVFGINDGKIKAVAFPASYFMVTVPSTANTRQGSARIRILKMVGIGSSTEPELVYFLPHITTEVCMEINKILGVDNPSDALPTITESTAPDYTGVFTGANAYTDVSGGLTGKPAFCAATTADGDTRFIKTLLAR